MGQEQNTTMPLGRHEIKKAMSYLIKASHKICKMNFSNYTFCGSCFNEGLEMLQ